MIRDVLILAAALIVGVLAAFRARDLRLDPSIEPLLEASDEALEAVRAFDRELPPPVVDARIVVRWPQEIGRDEVAVVHEIGEGLRARDGIAGVVSLASVPVIEERGGVRRPIPFRRVLGQEPELTVAALAERHPLVSGALISHDRRSAVIQVVARPGARIAPPDVLYPTLEEWMDEAIPADAEFDLIGGHPINGAIFDLMKRDIVKTVILETLLLGVLLPLMFRTWRGSILPLAVVNLAVVADLGLMSVLGMRFTIIDVAIPGLVLVIGLCDAVHMIHHFELRMAATGDEVEAVRSMLRRVGPACFFTSFTTALGFLSLLVAEHTLVREFAVKAGMAVGVAFVTVVGLMPVALRLWPVRHAARDPMGAIRRLGFGRPRLVALVAGLVVVFSVLGGRLVRVDSHWLEELPPDEPVVRELLRFERDFHGVLWMEARLEGDLTRPDALAGIEAIEARMLEETGVTRTESVADWLREADANRDGPLDEASVARGVGLLALAGSWFPSHVVTPGYDGGRLFLFTEDIGTVRYMELKRLFESEVAASLPEGVNAEISGYLLMAHRSGQLLVDTMLRSLGVSLAAISLFIMLIYRSVRMGLIALIPNVIPILVAWGLLGWTGTSLRTGTVMIFSLGLGLAVDDTIHLMTRFRQELAHGGSVHEVLQRALSTSGKALVTSSVILAVGTLCFLVGDFRSLVDVGFLLTAVIVTAALADLFLLPLLLERLHRERQPPARVSRAAAGVPRR